MRVLLLAAVACAPLEPIELDGRCGNRIVEPELGEDCDGAIACGAPAGAAACRFTCTDGDCPSDQFLCGADRICRTPRSDPLTAFAPAREILLEAFEIEIADIDGDQIEDLALLKSEELEVRFGDLDGAYGSSFRLNVDSSGGIDAADLDGDGLSDLIVEQIGGPLILRGRPGKRLEQVTRPIRALPRGRFDEPGSLPHVRLLSARVVEGEGARHSVMLEALGSMVRIDLPLDFLSAAILPIPAAVSALPRSIAVAETSTDSDVESIALAGFQSSEVAIVDVECSASLAMLDCTAEIAGTVSLTRSAPPRLVDGGTFFSDVDGDGRLDLVVGVSYDEDFARKSGIEVAFNVGLGKFCAVPAPACTEVDVGYSSALDIFVGTEQPRPDLLLYAGDLDGAPPGDFAFVDYGFLGNTVIRGESLTYDGARFRLDGALGLGGTFTSPWSGFAKGDFNRDGLVDFAAYRSQSRVVDAFLGTDRPLLSTFTYQVDGVVDQLVIGDFDGDLHDDLAVAESGTGVSVLFGSPQGLSDRVVMSTAPNVASLSAADVRSASGFDYATDLLVITASVAMGEPDAQFFVTLLHGSSRRRMVAPLNFVSGERRVLELFAGTVVGSFGADAFEDLLVFTLRTDVGMPIPDRLWIVEGDSDHSQLPNQLIVEPSCSTLFACGGSQEPEIANFDLEDPDDELLIAVYCASAAEVWVVNVVGGRSASCERVPDLDGGTRYAAFDLDLDGVAEVGIQDAIGEYRVSRLAGDRWTSQPLRTESGAPIQQIQPLPGGWAGFIADFEPYVGRIDGTILRGKKLGLGSVDPRILGFDGMDQPPSVPRPGFVQADVDSLDVTGDGLVDLLFFGTYLVEQLECDAASQVAGACGASEGE